MLAVFDTNILVDYLNGIAKAQREIARHRQGAISIISWMEVMVGARDEDDEQILAEFLGGFETLELDRDTAVEAVRLRRTHRMRLPDAIIWATARARGALLVTRNTRDFPRDDPAVRIPYRL